jgi:uncharacterized protein (DUF302 family)
MNRLLGTSNDGILTLLRLVLGVVFFLHGAQKVLGWFGGFGFSGTMQAFTGMMHIPAPFAFLAIMAEFLGGIGLLVGFLARVAALGIAVNMCVAIALAGDCDCRNDYDSRGGRFFCRSRDHNKGLMKSAHWHGYLEVDMGAARVGLDIGNGIERVLSTRSFDETVTYFKQLLAAKGMTTFAQIDFTGDAKRAGLTMPRMMLLVFGNPKGGTPVMAAAPSSALDLPLKVLVSEEPDGTAWLSFNTPEYLASRHGIPAEFVANIAVIRGLVGAAAA